MEAAAEGEGAMQAGYEEEASSKEAPQLASATAKPTRLHLVSMQIEGGWHADMQSACQVRLRAARGPAGQPHC